MAEKERLMKDALERDYLLFFEHDPTVGCIAPVKNERGRVVIGDMIPVDGMEL
jgi:hypothetical protein